MSNNFVSLKDALFLTHPVPKNMEQQRVFDMIASDSLPAAETWEYNISTKKMTWHDVIHNIFNKDGKVNNYMAQLRNLRNVMKAGDVTNEDIQLMCEMISNPDAVRRSKQLPFRFLSAYRVVRELDHPMLNSVLDALESAASVSVENMPKLPGTTLIACDVSGSMTGAPISKNSSIYPYDIGIVLGSVAHLFCDMSITGIFGTNWMQLPMSKHSGIFGTVEQMHRHDRDVGWSTNGYKVIEYLLEKDIKVDRIMLFTDCQMWDSHNDKQFAPIFLKYQRKYPDVKLYLFDLSGYGNIVVPQDTKNLCLVAGWSDRVFDFIQMFEGMGKGTSALDKIWAITP